MEERVTELEIKLSFQDDLIHKLNDALVDVRRELDALTLRMERLERRQAQDDAERGCAP